MAQQFIDFGTFPNDPSADPIRSAFQKIQNNFTDLYNTTITAGVAELAVGPGLAQNRTIGNIYLTANIPNITIQTGNSLLVGVGVATGNAATIFSYNTPFVLNLANTITTVNANLLGNVRTSNLNVANFVTSALVPNANVTYDLGTPTNRWKDIYLSGSSIHLGPQIIGANASGVTVANILVSSNVTAGNINATGNVSVGNFAVTGGANVTGNVNVGNISTSRVVTTANANIGGNLNVTGNANVSNLRVSGIVYGNLIPATAEQQNLGSASYPWKDLYLSGNTLVLGTQTISSNSSGIIIGSATITNALNAGNVTATFLGGTLTSPNQPLITSVGNLSSLTVQGNLTTGEMTVAGNLSVDSNLKVTGSLETQTITVTQIITPPNVEVSLAAPGSNTQLMFNDGGNIAAVSGMSFDKNNNILTIQGNVEGGNVVTSGAIVGNAATVNSLAASTIAATGNANVGNLITVGILASTANLTGNLNTQGFLTVVGNASVGNITTTTIDGVTVSVSGNVSGANLVASGILRVDGNANVGNLTTSGRVSAATLEAIGNITAGNLSVGGALTVDLLSGNNINTAGNLSVTGNANLGIVTASLLAASGNITANGSLLSNGELTVQSSATISSGLNVGANITLASIVGDGSNVVASFAAQSYVPFPIGSTVVISGVTPTNYNGSFTVASANNSQVTFTSTVAGNVTVLGRIATGGTALSIRGNANVTNLNVANFVGTDAALTNLTFASSGILSLQNGTASIGNIATALLEASGNVSAGNLYSRGILTVDGNVNANRITIANAVVTNNYSVGGQITIGANLAVTNASGTGSIVTITFNVQDTAPFPIGSIIVVSGVTPAAYNGTFTVTTCSTTQVTYSSTATGSFVSGGTLASSGTGLILQSVANVGGLNTSGNVNAGNVTGGTFTATLFSGNGADITGINIFNTSATVIVSSVAGTGSVCTLTYPTQSFAPFTVGQNITVAGVTPVAYNGTFMVVSSNTTTVTFNHNATGSSGFVPSVGTITGGPKSESSLVSNQVISSSQPNITSVGTLTGLSLNGGLVGTDITSNGFVYVSVGTGIIAEGTNQGTATGLTKQVNLISGGVTGSGVRLPGATVGMQLILINATSVPINVYPATSAQIDNLATNVPFTLGIGSRLMVVATGITQWYTMVGVYG